MYCIRKILFLLLPLIAGLYVHAQTPLISQNFVANNFFNPAAVGFGLNNQFQVFYRNQFSGVGNPYKTIGFGVDFALFKNYDNEYANNFGIGVQGFSEQLLNGILQTNQLTVSISNRIFFNSKKTSYLAVGISPTMISRNIDRAALTFGDQYNSGRLFNTSSLEKIGSFPILFSTNAGILYSYISPNTFLQFGGSTFYINRNSGNQIYWKTQSFQFVGNINIEKKLFEDNSFFIHANYQKRVESSFLFIGGALGIPINSFDNAQNKFYLGCFYRSKDAVVPYIGLMYNRNKIGFTYDVYQNNMTSSNLHPQTFEFTLTSNLGRRKASLLRSIFN